jgi:hypothetical protein
MLGSIVLWIAGLALLVIGIAQTRAPLARYRSLRATQENLKRYDEWRGNRLTPSDGEKTGADEMMEVLRQRTLLWGAVAVIGVILIVAGFLVR